MLEDLTILIPCYNDSSIILDHIKLVAGKARVIVVDDGSVDDTLDKLKTIDNIEVYSNKTNLGIAETRNILVSKVKTRYFTFMDSDDYIDLNVVDRIDLASDFDILSYSYVTCNEDKTIIKCFDKLEYTGNGLDYLNKLILEKKNFTVAGSYIINTNYYRENNFSFTKGLVHEDFGMIPLLLMNAKKVKASLDIFYYYVQTDYSITRGNDSLKTYNNAMDAIEQFLILKDKIDPSNQIIYSYLVNSLVLKIPTLDGKYREKYIHKLNELDISKYYLNNIKGIIKKIIYKIKYSKY